MNKFLIISRSGKSASQAASWMRSFGMGSPLRSRREGLLPTEITRMICKAHQAPRITLPVEESGFNQIGAGKAWYEFASDLLCANSNMNVWGWDDPRAIFLLEYWKEMDSKMAFVFIYDGPQNAIQEASKPFKNDEGEQPGVGDSLKNWMAYNRAMLDFHQKHPERCLLVHHRRITESPYEFYESLQDMLANDTASSSFVFTNDLPPPTAVAGDKEGGEHAIRNMLRICTTNPREAMADLLSGTTESFLAGLITTECPEVLDFYGELQASADLPWFDPKETEPTSVRCAWDSFARQRMKTMEIILQLHNERLVFLSQLHAMQDQLEKVYVKENQPPKPHSEPAASKPEPKSRQEEKPPAAESAVQEKAGAPLGAADRVKAQLSYRVGNALVSRSRTPFGWLGMPMAIARECRDFKRDRKLRESKTLPPLESYADAQEAVKVKQQLSYRIGSTLVRYGRTPLGWCKIPLAIIHDIRAFNHSKVK